MDLFFRGMERSVLIRCLMRERSGPGPGSYTHSFVTLQALFQASSTLIPARSQSSEMSSHKSLGGRPVSRKFWKRSCHFLARPDITGPAQNEKQNRAPADP